MVEFTEWLNTIHDTIKFTSQVNATNINFLDATVIRTEDQVLTVKPFVKPTDRNPYLHFGSFHPRHLRINIPYGQ